MLIIMCCWNQDKKKKKTKNELSLIIGYDCGWYQPGRPVRSKETACRPLLATICMEYLYLVFSVARCITSLTLFRVICSTGLVKFCGRKERGGQVMMIRA